jgi:hypothetical protein
MFNFFRQKEKNKFIIAQSEDKKWDLENLEEWIQPARKNLPKWWKELPVNRFEKENFLQKTLEYSYIEDIDNFDLRSMPLNAKSCPSFVEIFNNSYLYKAPVDYFFEFNHTEKKWGWMSAEPQLFKVDTHHLVSQLWGHSKDNIFNVKFSNPYIIKTTQKLQTLIFLDNIYWQNKCPIKVLPGVLKVLPNYSVAINLNCYVDWDYITKNKITRYTINRGDVLAMMYSPEGVIPIEKRKFKENPKLWFMANYFKAIKEYYINQK